MSSDTKPRPRASSSAVSRTSHGRQPSAQAVKPNSVHTSDEFLADFLNPSFDPATYLNAKLPPLAPKTTASASSSAAAAVPLADLSQEAGALLSQLNAHTTRLSSTLTQLTDDILRSGSRLAYEVELLRGETLGLNETLHETLRDEVEQFIPGGLRGRAEEADDAYGGQKKELTTTTTTTTRHSEDEESAGRQVHTVGREDGAAAVPAMPAGTDADGGSTSTSGAKEPSCIRQLQTLTLVRARIDAVVKTFGDAMDFGFPPSEVSVTSSFLSVSAPEPGSEQQSSEEKGQEVMKRLREEISGLLRPSGGGGGDDAVAGIERAANRIEELKELVKVWRGTSEEKGRGRFVESLARMVEDRHRELMRELEMEQKKQQQQSAASPSKRVAGEGGVGRRTGSQAVAEDKAAQLQGGFGLISQLQKLRSGL